MERKKNRDRFAVSLSVIETAGSVITACLLMCVLWVIFNLDLIYHATVEPLVVQTLEGQVKPECLIED